MRCSKPCSPLLFLTRLVLGSALFLAGWHLVFGTAMLTAEEQHLLDGTPAALADAPRVVLVTAAFQAESPTSTDATPSASIDETTSPPTDSTTDQEDSKVEAKAVYKLALVPAHGGTRWTTGVHGRRLDGGAGSTDRRSPAGHRVVDTGLGSGGHRRAWRVVLFSAGGHVRHESAALGPRTRHTSRCCTHNSAASCWGLGCLGPVAACCRWISSCSAVRPTPTRRTPSNRRGLVPSPASFTSTGGLPIDTGIADHFGAMLYRRVIDPRLASRVVTMVRDPVARNVSSYVQHWDEIRGVRRAHERVPMPQLLRKFHDVFEHDEPLIWFDTVIREEFGVDVFASSFDRSRRWGGHRH